MTQKLLLSANEATVYGAYAAGCKVAVAYPGTPSTEILEAVSKFKDAIKCEWSVNEKVAMEVGIGASLAGERTLVAMKHVGLNVAMDPIMTATYTGVNGALVIIIADDPGMHSSQNEQDSRNLVKFMRAILLEPSDSQESYDMTRAAFDLSETFHAPVVIRQTTRTSHTSTIVDLRMPSLTYGEYAGLGYEKDIKKRVTVPLFARPMRLATQERVKACEEAANTSPFNFIETASRKDLGFVASSVAYQHVKEIFPEFPVLKLGMTNPMPRNLVKQFSESVERVVVVEELDPFLEDQIRAMGIPVVDHVTELNMLELNADRVRALRIELLNDVTAPVVTRYAGTVPGRPPVLCAGCSHRGVFYTLNKLGITVNGDIGCYTLGAFPPLNSMDTVVCMGASIGNAMGMKKAGYKNRICAVLGDSTFFHSGLTGITNVVYNKGNTCTIVLDNRITGMTGHQENPGSGKTLMGEDANITDIAQVCAAIGVKHVYSVGAYNLKELERILNEAIDLNEPSVVVVKGPCLIVAKLVGKSCYTIDPKKCKACGACFKLGCPAIARGASLGTRFQAMVDPTLCSGCDLCKQVCNFDAISKIR